MLAKYTFLRPSHAAFIGAVALCVFAGVYVVWDGGSVLSESQTAHTRNTPDTDDPFELGEYYFNQKANGGAYDLQKARQYYTEALRADPQGNPYTWYQLGRIDFIEGSFISAIYKFEKQIEYFDDEVPNVYYMLGLTYGYLARETNDLDDWKKAEEAFIRFITYSPTSPWPRVDLAWIYFSQGNYEEMLPILEEGLIYEPEHAWLLNTYGLALLNTGDREGAHAQFKKAQEAAAKLTVEDWGDAYSGNNPQEWGDGLTEFRQSIAHNLEISEPERSGMIPW